MPAPTGETVEESELEEVANAEIGERTKVRRELVVELLVLISTTFYRHPRLTLRIVTMLLLPLGKRQERIIDKLAFQLVVLSLGTLQFQLYGIYCIFVCLVYV